MVRAVRLHVTLLQQSIPDTIRDVWSRIEESRLHAEHRLCIKSTAAMDKMLALLNFDYSSHKYRIYSKKHTCSFR